MIRGTSNTIPTKNQPRRRKQHKSRRLICLSGKSERKQLVEGLHTIWDSGSSLLQALCVAFHTHVNHSVGTRWLLCFRASHLYARQKEDSGRTICPIGKAKTFLWSPQQIFHYAFLPSCFPHSNGSRESRCPVTGRE